MYSKQTILKILVMLISIGAFGQHDTQGEKSHEEESKPGLEAVLSGLFIRNTTEGITEYGTELHLTYWTSHKWAFGVGYTTIYEKEKQLGHELAGLISHKPNKFLTMNIGPSFSLPNSHQKTQVSAYTETEWAFHIGAIHAGPTLGALIGKDFRYFGGFHISYEF
ncbi:MAG: hypothetical protein ABGX00_15270 [Allomuricauda sp.]